MPSTRMHRGLVALSASAIAAVYMTGYLRTQAADATIAAAEPSLTAAPTAQVAVAAPPAVTVAPAPQTVVQRQVPVPPRPSATPATQAQPPAQSQPQARSQPQAQTQPQAPAQTQPQSQPQPQSPSQASQAAYKDGTYTGQGTSRRGDVWVQVDVAGGRISNVSITRSTLQYPLRDIAGLPQEVVDRQS
ncbi:MAG TPA: hypothetical protein VK898_07425, partial [Chloroflexota bacterium]|nr:hypothetical protein [Chloroflexota bacterium]